MRWTVTLAGLVLWGWVNLSSQSAVIRGEDPEYSGSVIELFIPGNPFLLRNGMIETVTCDETGSFKFEVTLDTGTLVRIRTGIYDGGIYVEPGQQYDVVLPPFRELDYTEAASPFFEQVSVPLRTRNNQRNNQEIYRFDSLFHLLNDQLIHSRRMGKTLSADSLIRVISTGFKREGKVWFDQYRRYKYGLLVLNEGKTGLESIGREYLGPVVREEHPAFMELFSAMYSDFLVYYGRTLEGSRIKHHINRTHHIDSLRNILLGHPAVWSDTLADLILLQELPSMFYQDGYHREAILMLLDSLQTDPAASRFSSYAGELRQQLASLMVGHTPPGFNLTGTSGQTISPSDFTGKYTLLMFCTPVHYGCMMEYPFLNSYVTKHHEYLDVVTIMVADSSEEVTEFMLRNKYLWNALCLEDQNGILRDYRVKAYPVAYLIGPDGKLVLSPAPLPSEGFEQQLFRIMRSRGEI